MLSLFTTVLLASTTCLAATAPNCTGPSKYCITNFKLPTASAPGANSSISFHLANSQAYLPDHPVTCSGKGPTDKDGLFKGEIKCRPNPDGGVNFGGQFNSYDLFAQFYLGDDPVESYSENFLPKRSFKKVGNKGLVKYVGPDHFDQSYTITH